VSAATPLQAADTVADPAAEDDRPEGGAAWYLIFVLTLAYTASFIDRQVLNLLVGPIKAEFQLSDTRLSLLQGLAFTISYIVMSPIFGRLADIGNRRNILTFGILLWSAGTSFCGLARSFWGLFLARLGVGGAEACLTPAAWSIITDSFPPRRIPRAFSVYMMGPYLGGGLALIFGGVLLESVSGWDRSGWPLLGSLAPWQLVFVLVGTPGLIVALMMRFVREPARHELAPEAKPEKADMAEVWRGFAERRGFYLTFYVGMALMVITLYGYPAWMPAMLMRQFGASPARVGIDYGVLVLIAGSLGVLSGPVIANWLARRGRKDQLLLVPLICTLLLVPVSGLLLVVKSYHAALAVGTLAAYLYSLPQALASSALQLATPNRMRGLASAIYVFAVSVAGLGIAPTVIALMTDHVFADEKLVGASLSIVCMVSAGLGGLLLIRCLGTYRRMVA
jgi:MFS transporter, Spinster family, sphingosine-1-phosphate transporter